MEFALTTGELEVRASRNGGRKLRGRFKYNSRAVLSSDGKNGRPQKEEVASRAFAYRVNKPDEEIHLLVGHSYDKPLASKLNQTLHLVDSDEALTFDAEVTPQIADTSYGSDILKQIDSGLSVGLSPGFLLPPARRVEQSEKFTDEGHDPARGMFNARIRTILSALLFELSVVTRPAYKEATVAMYDDLGNVINPDDMTDEEKIAAGWTYNAAGILVPPPQTITRAMPAQLRWR